MSNKAKNPAMVLQELTVSKNLQNPEYEIIHSITGSHENRFDYRVRVAGIEALGTGTSKQISKHTAAHNALKKLEALGVYDPIENPVEEFKAAAIQKSCGLVPGSPLKSSLNCIGPLKDLCAENKIEDPVFTELSDVGPPHAREFTYECRIGSLITVATGNTKKMAKQLAAKEMLEKIKSTISTLVVEAPRIIDQKTLPPMEIDEIALETYQKLFGNIVINKKVKIDDFSLVFVHLMEENNLTIEDFIDDLNEETEESLTRLLNKINLQHTTSELQNNPYILTLSLNTDVPFSAIAMGCTYEETKSDLIKCTFEFLRSFFFKKGKCRGNKEQLKEGVFYEFSAFSNK